MLVEYDGTKYKGFQVQRDQPTVQGELEAALARFTAQPVRIRGASRTDSGAHALGQVVDFTTQAERATGSFPAGMNFYLPEDIRVQDAWRMVPEFHCRKSAASRTYRYHITNRRWPSPSDRYTRHWVREPLNVDLMEEAATSLVGEWDFRPLVPDHPFERSAVRTVSRWESWRDGVEVIIECEANGFLKHLVRRANAILIEVGKGKLETDILSRLLSGEMNEGFHLPSIPACGLCLMKVTYPKFWSHVIREDEEN